MVSRIKHLGMAVAVTVYFRTAEATCSDNNVPDISFASSSNRLYINSGCATVADILGTRLTGKGVQKGPIWHFDQSNNLFADSYTGTYYTTADIFIRNGATLEIDGSDCETLLLASNSNVTLDDSLNIRAHGGNLVIRDTKIFSWDIDAGDYDHNTDDGRAYVSAITEKLTGRDIDLCPDDERSGETGYSTGQAKNDMGNARMDIYNSELAYLGYPASESYGVAYKARGLCKTLINVDIFDDDNGLDYAVYGDILNSHLHHNYFGHYSYGHQGGRWNNNEVNDNVGYGFDPHDDSDHLEIIGNTVYNNGWHGIIASKRCTDITISDNVVYNNGRNGIMLHRQCDRAKVSGNYVYNNGDSGLALYESSDCTVNDNRFYWNTGHGIRWSNGANRNDVYSNSIRTSSTSDGESNRYGLYMYAGNDEPQAVGNEDGRILDNVVRLNTIRSGNDKAMHIQEADNNGFYSNNFLTGLYAEVRDSTYNIMRRTRHRNADFYIKVESDSCFVSSTDEDVPFC